MNKLVVANRQNTLKQTFARFAAIALVGAPMIASADIGTDLETAAETAIAAVLVTVGSILVAAFALPVGRKVYRVIKSALGGA